MAGGSKHARSSSRSKAKQSSLAAGNILPVLKKPSQAVGLYCQVPGSFWEGCPASDAKKVFKCVVVEFEAVHTFDGGRKGPAFIMKEMGESGEGSLEPGIASGEDFVLAYPSPFLRYYYDANPDHLPDTMQPVVDNDEGGNVEDVGQQPEVGAALKGVKEERPLVFKYLTPVSSMLVVGGG